MRSKSITIVLLDGSPYGIKIAKLANWNGQAIIAPRSALKRLKTLPEGNMPAVYFLLSDENKIYIGETDTLSDRLSQHNANRADWTTFIAFTSPEIGKTDVKYLEYVLAERVKLDGLATLENATSPQSPTIKASDKDALDDFVDRASDILLSLGYTILGVNEDIETRTKEKGLEVILNSKDSNANGFYNQDGLLVVKGSLARKVHTPSFEKLPCYRYYKQLLQNGVLVPQGSKHLVFTQDHLFSSPSLAAAMVRGTSSNGLTEWKTKENKTLKELEP